MFPFIVIYGKAYNHRTKTNGAAKYAEDRKRCAIRADPLIRRADTEDRGLRS
jgi:hypothetical protein